MVKQRLVARDECCASNGSQKSPQVHIVGIGAFGRPVGSGVVHVSVPHTGRPSATRRQAPAPSSTHFSNTGANCSTNTRIQGSARIGQARGITVLGGFQTPLRQMHDVFESDDANRIACARRCNMTHASRRGGLPHGCRSQILRAHAAVSCHQEARHCATREVAARADRRRQASVVTNWRDRTLWSGASPGGVLPRRAWRR